MQIPKKNFRRTHIAGSAREQLGRGVSVMNFSARPLFAVLAVFALLAALLAACDKNPLGTVENGGNAPFLSLPTLTPTSVYIDSLTPSAGIYSFAVDVRVRATDADGADNIVSVNAALVRPGESTPYLEFPLLDNGVAPDSVSGDGMYGARLQFGVTRSQAGIYRVQISAVDRTRLSSNGVDLPLNVRRRNSVPVLSNLVAPDTVTLPVGGSIDVSMTISASDSDGLADIREVYFRSLTSSNPSFKFLLKDDGGADTPPFTGWPTSGDLVAGDGIYSIQIPLVDGQAQRRTNTFSFQAIDTYGDTSAAIIHNLTVK